MSLPSSVAVQADGKVVVAGAYIQNNAPRYLDLRALGIRRYNNDGSLDASFGSNGQANLPLPSGLAEDVIVSGLGKIIVQPDGKLVFVSSLGIRPYNVSPPSYESVVYRVDADGQPDPSFGSHGVAVISALLPRLGSVAIAADGSVLVGGLAESAGGTQVAVARLTLAGSLDSTFGTGGLVTLASGSGGDEAVTASGRILVAASVYAPVTSTVPTTIANVFGVVYGLRPEGSLDPTFGTDGVVYPEVAYLASMAVAPDGRVALFGTLQTVGLQTAVVELLQADGTADPTFSSATSRTARAASRSDGSYSRVAFQADGKIVAHLRTDSVPPPSTIFIDRFLASGIPDVAYAAGGRASVPLETISKRALLAGMVRV